MIVGLNAFRLEFIDEPMQADFYRTDEIFWFEKKKKHDIWWPSSSDFPFIISYCKFAATKQRPYHEN